MRKILFTGSLSLILAGSALAGDIPIPRSTNNFPPPGFDGKTPIVTAERETPYTPGVEFIKLMLDILF